MNNVLKQIMESSTPRINKKITDGTAREVLRTIPAYLDSFFESGLASLAPGINFKYLGYRRMSPKEEYTNMVLRRAGTISYDLSHNDVYVVEFRFEYDGVVINKPMYLMYAEDNITVMGDTNYHITPVLSDTVISPTAGGVFMRLLKAKLNFMSRSRYFMENGVRCAGNVIYGDILKSKKVTDMIGRPLTSTPLYILGKYGLVETLRRYGGVEDVIVTNVDDVTSFEGYHVYESMKVKPRGHKAVPYIPHNVKILVKGGSDNKSFVDSVVHGVIYTLDILPELEQDMVALLGAGDVETEISFWRITLGRVIYKNSYSVYRITQDLEDHFNALEGYVDAHIKTKLKEAGIYVNDFFDLLAHLLTNYTKLIHTSREYNSNIENRYIDVLYYLTYDVIAGFNRVILSLNKRITKTDVISHKEVVKILSNELSSKKVYGLTKSTEPNLAVTNVDYSGDIKYPKVTSILEDQWSFA